MSVRAKHVFLVRAAAPFAREPVTRSGKVSLTSLDIRAMFWPAYAQVSIVWMASGFAVERDSVVEIVLVADEDADDVTSALVDDLCQNLALSKD